MISCLLFLFPTTKRSFLKRNPTAMICFRDEFYHMSCAIKKFFLRWYTRTCFVLLCVHICLVTQSDQCFSLQSTGTVPSLLSYRFFNENCMTTIKRFPDQDPIVFIKTMHICLRALSYRTDCSTSSIGVPWIRLVMWTYCRGTNQRSGPAVMNCLPPDRMRKDRSQGSRLLLRPLVWSEVAESKGVVEIDCCR